MPVEGEVCADANSPIGICEPQLLFNFVEVLENFSMQRRVQN